MAVYVYMYFNKFFARGKQEIIDVSEIWRKSKYDNRKFPNNYEFFMQKEKERQFFF